MTQLSADVDDARRLDALAAYQILDTETEDAFDDLVALARQLCGTPTALISLVDRDRQWFKARIGFDRQETDLDSSVCRHALGCSDLLVIDDLSLDQRTRANPLVTGSPGLRFYAGAPILAAAGQCLGALCVLDTVPRPQGLTGVQADGLIRLARQVERQLELRRRTHDAEARAIQTPAEATGAALIQEQQLLNQELGHRLKNTLAIVQALSSQTLRDLPDRASVETFQARLRALGGAHELLLRRDWDSAPLAEVAAHVLTPFGRRNRFQVDGPAIDLGSRAVLSASLVLHELATNATKYGALTVPGGNVLLSWRVEGDRLIVDWSERGGPPAVEPTRRGFGSRLLRSGLAGSGGTKLRYEAEGFSATLTVGLAELSRG